MTGDVRSRERPRLASPGVWERLATSRRAAAIAFGWGFAEATVFFVVPDVWIGLLALFSWRAGLRAVTWAIAGALLGGAVMYGAGASLDSESTARFLAVIPAVSPAMIDRVEREMHERGPASMLLGPLRGTPYKLYARAAGVQRQPIAATLLWTIPARGARFLLVAALAAAYGAVDRRFTPRLAWRLGPYLLAWAVFYTWYFWTVGF